MNQYRHSKSSLFLMEIILNIFFFFDSCNILCPDIFQRIPALGKYKKATSGGDCLCIDCRDLPEHGFPERSLKFHLSGIHESGRNDFDLL